MLDSVIGGFKQSERTVSDALDAHVGSGTLLLADRGLWGLARWHRLRDQGTHMPWRIERRKARRLQDVLSDGPTGPGPGDRVLRGRPPAIRWTKPPACTAVRKP
ncbi:hypothetical protein [Streptomyces chartreusis]|uniref:hypothetical protein n=1 Tax=Streptomyces chartreusis TaxID=1969 RepID=UPI00363A6869